MPRKTFLLAAVLLHELLFLPAATGQTKTLLPSSQFHSIRDESSGERPLVDFRNIVTRFAGFTPSKGGDGVAEYIVGRLRGYGLDEVETESFSSDGKTFSWSFLGEPAWDGKWECSRWLSLNSNGWRTLVSNAWFSAATARTPMSRLN